VVRKAPKIIRKKYKGPQLKDRGGKLGDAPDADALFLQSRRLKSGDKTLYLDPDLEQTLRRRKKVEKMKSGGALLLGRGGTFKGIF